MSIIIRVLKQYKFLRNSFKDVAKDSFFFLINRIKGLKFFSQSTIITLPSKCRTY